MRRTALPTMTVVGVLAALPALLIGFFEDISPKARELEPTSSTVEAYPDFAGSDKCAGCHPREYAQWSSSQHKAAMQPATDRTVLGDFANRTFVDKGDTSSFFKRDGRFWVRTPGPDGKLEDFEIGYTFGVFPLQQYLISLPRGHWQAFGIAWDSRSKADGGQRWFSLGTGKRAGDPMHWTGIDQNWNYQCAWCHSTNIQKNYAAETDTFSTTWSEISVGCEACHGPASSHVSWATQPKDNIAYDDQNFGLLRKFDERRTVSWPMENGQAHRSIPRATSKEIEACAPCHSRRQQFSSDRGALAHLFDAFRPSTLEPGLYYSDGQQREEVYTYGSFLQSRMFAQGVTCSDCHNPHTGKLRFEGNAVCTQCHSSDRFDSPTHHHHRVDAASGKCTSCHMPTTTYMAIDERHDHSMRIPRPDRTISIGAPNACNKCHTDKSAAWAVQAIRTWYPSPKLGDQDFAEAFDLGIRGAPGAQAALRSIAAAPSGSAIARASALNRLARFPSPSILDLAARSLKDDDPLVRAAAVSVAVNGDRQRRRDLLIPLLSDSSRLVRIDAARALADLPDSEMTDEARTRRGRATEEYVTAQLFNAERPESQTNLGGFYREQGNFVEARKAFERAIALDPSFVAAPISLADMVRQQGDERAAEFILRKSLDANPKSAPIEHALGLSLIRQKRTAEGVEHLAAAVRADSADPHLSYVFAVAQHDTGRTTDALVTLKSALSRNTYDRELLWALASYEAEAGDVKSAIDRVALLSALEPEQSSILDTLAELKRLSPKPN